MLPSRISRFRSMQYQMTAFGCDGIAGAGLQDGGLSIGPGLDAPPAGGSPPAWRSPHCDLGLQGQPPSNRR